MICAQFPSETPFAITLCPSEIWRFLDRSRPGRTDIDICSSLTNKLEYISRFQLGIGNFLCIGYWGVERDRRSGECRWC